MKPRTCFVQICISNEKGEQAWYSLRPLPAEELAQSAAGFFLTKLSADSPVYAVRAELDGSVSCNCPQYRFGSSCKHSSALVAAAVLPAGLLSVLKSRSQLLAHAEAEALRLAEVAAEEKQIFDQDLQWRADRVADLNEQLERLEAELESRKPKPRRRRAARAA